MRVKFRPVFQAENEQGSAPVGGEAPAEAAPAEGEGSASGDGLDILDFFEGMQRDYEDPVETPAETGEETGTPGTGAEEAPASTQVEGGSPASGSAATVTPEVQPTTTPVVAQPQGGTPEQAQGGPTPSQQATSAEEVQPDQILAKVHEEVAKQKDVFTKALAESQYKLSPEQQEQLISDPAALISNLMAQVHVNVTAALTKVMATHVPATVAGVTEATRVAQERENSFFAAWPNLKRSEKAHYDAVVAYGKVFNQMNPKATAQDFIKEVGMMASVRLGLPLQPQTPQGGAAPQVRTPGPVVRQVAAAFQPGGARAAGAPPPVAKSEWEQFAQFIQLEESGALDT
jgi:hypothetical protein